MADKKDLDIAAFPMVAPEIWGFAQDGMSLRDWFAGHALVGLLSGRAKSLVFTSEQVASNAYAIAQGMLEERAKYEGEETDD